MLLLVLHKTPLSYEYHEDLSQASILSNEKSHEMKADMLDSTVHPVSISTSAISTASGNALAGETETSSPSELISGLNDRVQPLELGTRVGSGELPSDGSLVGVAVGFPRRHLTA